MCKVPKIEDRLYNKMGQIKQLENELKKCKAK